MEANNQLALAGGASGHYQLNLFDPKQFETVQRMCKLYANSELVPDMYKVTEKNPMEKAVANCLIALEMAGRIGASPLMVMQNMIIIYGRPSWSSKFLIATVNSCGRFEPLKFRFTEKGMLGKIDYTDYEYQNGRKVPVKKTFDGTKIMDIECVAYTTAKGSKDVLESSPISLRLAIQEGWYLKNGSKWQTMARQMLMYRAASFWTNVYAPELSMGMRTVEENEDIEDVNFIEVKADAKVEMQREKEALASKETLQGFEAEASSMQVDEETGEILDEAKEQTAEAETNPNDDALPKTPPF